MLCRAASLLVTALLSLAPGLKAVDLIVPSAASVSLAAGTYSYGVVQVQTGGTLTIHDAVQVYAATFEVQAGGVVDGNGRGFAGSNDFFNPAGSGPGGGPGNGDGAGHVGQ